MSSDPMLGTVERIRSNTRSDGVHAIYRVPGDRHEPMDVIPLPDPGLRNPLVGISHVPLARAVIYVQHLRGHADPCFRAFSMFGDTDTAYFAGPDGAIEVVPNGVADHPMLYLLLNRIATGTPLPPWPHSPEEWVIRSALKAVVDDLDASRSPDGWPTAYHADEVLRRDIAERITILRRAENPLMDTTAIGSDRADLNAFAPFLGTVDWDDVDVATLAAELGYTEDESRWWTARGVGCLDQIDLPDSSESMTWLSIERPVVADFLTITVADLFDRMPERGSPGPGMLTRWRNDDPHALVELAHEVFADWQSRYSGGVLVGYLRGDTGRLRQVFRYSVGATGDAVGFDLPSIRTPAPADGAMLVCRGERAWTAVAMNREGESGAAASSLETAADQFAVPLVNPSLAAALRRIVTGHATVDSACTPFEWLRRRVLFGVARALETGKVDGTISPKPTPDHESEDQPLPAWFAKLAERRPTADVVIDLNLVVLLMIHAKPLISATYPAAWFERASRREPDDDEVWELYAAGLKILRSLRWADMRVEPLAQAWAIPLEEAEWWRPEGFGPLQALGIPDETESVMRCAHRAADAVDHLHARVEQLFGDDAPILWSFVRPPERGDR